jgi:uncharacterized integral membrane protein
MSGFGTHREDQPGGPGAQGAPTPGGSGTQGEPAPGTPADRAPAGEPDTGTVPGEREAAQPRGGTGGGVPRTRAGGLWVAVAASGVLLLFLLIFILQNLQVASVHFLGARWRVPIGAALLLAAVAGILLAAMAGTARIIQLRLLARRRAGGNQPPAAPGTAVAGPDAPGTGVARPRDAGPPAAASGPAPR